MAKIAHSCVVAMAAWAFLCCADSRSAQGGEADVDRLVRAAAAGGTSGFVALLQLRDLGDDRALPFLVQTLERHHGSGNIFGFAAAQALFCIGTDKAHKVLRKYVLTRGYDAALGIRYALHHKMPQAKRDAFIEQYHLVSTSKDLAIGLQAKPAKAGVGQQVAFTVTLRNASPRPLRIYKPGVYLAKLLVIRSAAGRFLPKTKTVDYGYHIGQRNFPELAPGERLHFTIVATVRRERARPPRPRRKDTAPAGALRLTTRDMAHRLGKAGKFRVYALYSVAKRFAEGQGKRLGLAEAWSGRVASRPVEIEILPASRADEPRIR